MRIPEQWKNKPALVGQAIDNEYVLKGYVRVDGFVYDKTEQYIRDYDLPFRFWTIVRDMIINSDGNFEAVDKWMARFSNSQGDTHETKR